MAILGVGLGHQILSQFNVIIHDTFKRIPIYFGPTIATSYFPDDTSV